VITVYEHLQSLGKAEEMGGLAYLNSLAQYVPSASNIRRYAEIVRERSILRKLVSASDEIATNAFNPRASRSTHPGRGRAEDLQHRREGSRMKQGFQAMDSLVVTCSTACRRWPTTRTTSPVCPPAFTTWTA
jgi:replicative DNA helicase